MKLTVENARKKYEKNRQKFIKKESQKAIKHIIKCINKGHKDEINEVFEYEEAAKICSDYFESKNFHVWKTTTIIKDLPEVVVYL